MRIKIRLGYDKELDGYDPGEVIAITFAEAKLNSIQNRGGTLSNRFGLAKTANNKRVLGVLDEVRNQDDKPYKRHDCTIEVEGLQVFYGFALIEESSDKYYLRVYGRQSDFFLDNGEKLLSDFDLSAHDHTYNGATVNDARQNAVGDFYVYPNINYGRWTDLDLPTSTDYYDFFPAIYVQDLLQLIATQSGYTLSAYDADGWALPFSRPNFRTSRLSQSKARISSDISVIYTTTSPIQQDFDTTDFDNQQRINLGAGEFTLFGNGSYKLKGRMIADADIGNSGDMVVRFVINNAGNTRSIKNWVLTAGQSIDEEVEFSYAEDDDVDVQLEFQFNTSGDSGTISAGTYIELLSAEELMQVDRGWTVTLEETLPDITVKDLFLQEAVRLNALLVVNPLAQTIEFVKFNDIAARYPVSTDWTNKLDYSDEPKIEFRLDGYAQSNYLKWADEDTSIDHGYRENSQVGQGTISIDDSGLPEEKTLFTSKFAASSLYRAFNDEPDLIHIPIYNSSADNFLEYRNTVAPRIVKITVDNTFLIDITSQSVLGTQANASFDDWETIIYDYYAALSAAFTKTKTAEVLVRLNAVDILELDFTRPVYLLNEYWFIREVKQWKANEPDSTIVKLLRL